jgi:hypothetical protein
LSSLALAGFWRVEIVERDPQEGGAGTSTVLIKAKDTTGPTPGMVINR